jgi:tubulin polyglutamylase TTLL6/13
MHKPYLIDNLKFDMRIYVLVYGVDPLRLFVFREGLARFATEEYTGPYRNNLDNLFMHLTNYAINKNAENFEANEDSDDDDTGHKRSASSVLRTIAELEKDNGVTVDKLWAQIDDIAAKTLISAQPLLSHTFRSTHPDDLENSMCFELLGIDIFIDENVKPWLIEVNSLASFATDSPLDKRIKFDVVYETLAMLKMDPKRKKKAKKDKAEQFNRRQYKEQAMTKQQREQIRSKLQAERDKWDDYICTGFKKVYPSSDPAKQEQYDKLLSQAKLNFNEFTNTNRREQ